VSRKPLFRAGGVALACVAAGTTSLLPAADMPAALRPAANERPLMTLHARGHQLYECRAAASGGHAWVFVAPEAELFDRDGRVAGSHGAGPHWLASDGSRIVGQVKGRADATVAGAIPWLLLAAQTVGPQGRFSPVTAIQRINTAGGLPPDQPCHPGNAGITARTPYTADYRFLSSTWEPLR